MQHKIKIHRDLFCLEIDETGSILHCSNENDQLHLFSKLCLTFWALRFPPLDNSFIVLGDVTPT